METSTNGAQLGAIEPYKIQAHFDAFRRQLIVKTEQTVQLD